jgi:hypothetical protein
MLNPYAQIMNPRLLYAMGYTVKGKRPATYEDFIDGITYNPSKSDEPGYVYLINKLPRALSYAKGKADYFRTKPGDKFMFDGDWEVTKEQDAPFMPNVKPVVLRLDLPNGMKGFEFDPRDDEAVRFKGTIPPKYISQVTGVIQ